jgi:hypothetical protein
MAFDEVSGSNSTALPYGGDEFARLVNQYETDEFVHMIQNVECDITGHFDEIGETCKTFVYENDISKHFDDFESYEYRAQNAVYDEYTMYSIHYTVYRL